MDLFNFKAHFKGTLIYSRLIEGRKGATDVCRDPIHFGAPTTEVLNLGQQMCKPELEQEVAKRIITVCSLESGGE